MHPQVHLYHYLEVVQQMVISSKPSTYTPTIGTTSTTAFRGDYGNVAYNHSQQPHAPSNAQKNSDITKAEIEAKLTGSIGTHTHNYLPLSGGTVTGSFTSNNIITVKSTVRLNNAKRVIMKNKDAVDASIMTLNSSNNFHIGYGPYDNGETTGTTYLSGATGITFRTVNGNIKFYPSKSNIANMTPTSLTIASKSNATYMCLDVHRKCDTNTASSYAGSTARIGIVNSLGGCSALEYREGTETLSYFRVYKDCVMFNGKRMTISANAPSGTKTTGDLWFDI